MELELRASEPSAFLKAFDIPYRVRKYTRLLEVLAPLYRQPALRPLWGELDDLELRLWAALDRARHAERQAWNPGTIQGLGAFPELVKRLQSPSAERDAVQELVSKAQDFLSQELDTVRSCGLEACQRLDTLLTDFNARDGQAEYPADTFVQMFQRFELRDLFFYLAAELGSLGKHDSVELVRISPDGARFIRRAPEEKLAGDSLLHFGGSLKREWRQNDILWGRLDAAELLVRTLARGPDLATAEQERLIRSVQQEIATEEHDALGGMRAGEDYRTFLEDAQRYRGGAEGPSALGFGRWASLSGRALQVAAHMMTTVQRHPTAHAGVRWMAGRASAPLWWLGAIARWVLTPAAVVLSTTLRPLNSVRTALAALRGRQGRG